ncbi:MAG: hypothetical protein CSB48_01620 [Proteobacteria bacterium]|nr:MAG: hypothetical protein CSB48_01620 [Pseudomonadota bacterium]PIE40245.1 MAG: hypothetical protein CSA51_01835 [Gammaproteobacteria bacterium]
MGKHIKSSKFSQNDYIAFSKKVRDELDVLRQVIALPGFGESPTSIGAELEFYIVDQQGHTLRINDTLCKEINHPQLQPELNRFNIEYNLAPQPIAGKPLTAMENEISRIWKTLNIEAGKHGGEVVPIGILPTLKRTDFGTESMTDIPRYHALSDGLRAMRGSPFEIAIQGEDTLSLTAEDVTLEGANTSFQFHWKMPPEQFVDAFNATQLITPVVTAISANSPFLLHHSLWEETRIALFKQSIDVRVFDLNSSAPCFWREPARVDYGQGWLRKSPIELFEHAVLLHPPLLPIVEEEDSRQLVTQGIVPELKNLRLHHGTTWAWNRAVYDHSGSGHLRIELRFLPAGPTLQDMLASATFAIGCAMAVMPDIEPVISGLPFKYAKRNFYEAARYGNAANLVWPTHNQTMLTQQPVIDIAKALLPRATEALIKAGIDHDEVVTRMENIKNRLEADITGASWQRTLVRKLQANCNRQEACQEMFNLYRKNQRTKAGIADWSTQI